MNFIDIVILAVLSISVLIGLSRGLTSEILALAIWGIAFWVSWMFGPTLAAQFEHSISFPSARLAAGYGICFVGVLVVGAIVKAMVNRMLIRSGLSGADRMLGMAFGFVRGVLLVSLVAFLLGMTAFTRESWWGSSSLLPKFQPVAAWLGSQMPANASRYLRSAPSALPDMSGLGDFHGFSGLTQGGGKLPDLHNLGASGMGGGNGLNNLFDLRGLQGLSGMGNLQGLRNLPGLNGLSGPTTRPPMAPAQASTAETPMYIR